MPAMPTDEATELRALKSDSFGRISLMQGAGGVFVRRDLAHVPLWLRLPAWWLARREALALRKVAGMADVPQLLDWTGRRLDRSYMEGAAMYQRPPRGDLAYYGVPGNRGFSATLNASKASGNVVCVYVANQGEGDTVMLGCKTK